MGGLASIVMGASMPVYAILFGEVLGILSKSIPDAREESIFYSAMFLVVGVVVGMNLIGLLQNGLSPSNTGCVSHLEMRYYRQRKKTENKCFLLQHACVSK